MIVMQPIQRKQVYGYVLYKGIRLVLHPVSESGI